MYICVYHEAGYSEELTDSMLGENSQLLHHTTPMLYGKNTHHPAYQTNKQMDGQIDKQIDTGRQTDR